MGKAKRNKKTASRDNPLSEILQDDPQSMADETSESFIEGIIAKLKSDKDVDRENGCESLCIASECHVPRILETGVLRILSPLLVDANQNVRRASVGALKNISLAPSEDIIREMMSADVLTPLLALLERLSKDMDDEETYIQGVQLLWNLCESSSSALERAFQDMGLLEFLLNSLSRSPRVRVPVLQCLLTVSEDCPNVDSYLGERKEVLQNLVASKTTSAQERILSAGILINILSDEHEDNELRPTIEAIASTLDKDHRVMISEYSEVLPSSKEEAEQRTKDKSEMDTEDSLGTEITALLSAQETALEILTNLFCDNDDEGEEDLESLEEDESIECMSNGGDKMSEETGEDYAPSISSVLVEALKKYQFVDKLLQKAILPPGDIIERLSESIEGKTLLKALKSMRSKAFLCLNNILLVDSLPLSELFEGASDDRLFEIWTELGTLCFGESGEKDSSVLEAAISALRALTSRLCAIRCKKFSGLSFKDLNMMLELSKVSGAEVKVNLVHILGDLGALSLGEEVSKGLTNYLLDTASRDGDVGVCAEALDKIFDMYAEDDTDGLAVEVSLVPRLKGLVSGFKVKSGRIPKNDSRSPLVHTAKVNLNRFIKYKSKRPVILKSL